MAGGKERSTDVAGAEQVQSVSGVEQERTVEGRRWDGDVPDDQTWEVKHL